MLLDDTWLDFFFKQFPFGSAKLVTVHILTDSFFMSNLLFLFFLSTCCSGKSLCRAFRSRFLLQFCPTYVQKRARLFASHKETFVWNYMRRNEALFDVCGSKHVSQFEVKLLVFPGTEHY